MCYLLPLDITSSIVFDEVPLIKSCALLKDLSSGGGLFRHLILSVRITFLFFTIRKSVRSEDPEADFHSALWQVSSM